MQTAVLYCSLSFAFQVSESAICSNGSNGEAVAAEAMAYDDDDIDEELEKVAMAVEEEVAAAANSADSDNR